MVHEVIWPYNFNQKHARYSKEGILHTNNKTDGDFLNYANYFVIDLTQLQNETVGREWMSHNLGLKPWYLEIHLTLCMEIEKGD